jgi:hypothetical protein
MLNNGGLWVQCQSCNYGDIDMSKSTFQTVLGDADVERYPITWYFL